MHCNKKATYLINDTSNCRPSLIWAKEKIPGLLISMICEHDNYMDIVFSELTN